MKELGTPMTRENYLELAYLKKNPVLSAEEETELPAQFQLRDPEESDGFIIHTVPGSSDR